MGTRELIILLLGLAVVAVILRGLYIAMQSRRGQLRLAIDKNIPQDVDLNALEMAELPNGGARVVSRSLEQVNRQNAMAAGAAALDLADAAAAAGPVPILMDTVELGQVRQVKVAPPAVAMGKEYDDDEDFDEDFEEDELDEDFDDDDEVDFDEDLDKELEEIEEEEFDDDFDEDEVDEDDEEDEDGSYAPYRDGDEDDDDEEDFDDFDEDEDDDDEEFLDRPGDGDDYFDDDESYNRAGNRTEPTFDATDLEDEFDTVPMTAGERIGGQPEASGPPLAARSKGVQSSLFAEAEAPQPAPKRASLLERFGDRRHGKPKPAAVAPAGQKVEPKSVPAKDIRAAREAREQRDTRAAEPSEVLVINVMSREGEVFHGDDLMQALITTGLKFGQMSIFHHRLNNASSGPVIFSVANVLNPGTFDLNNMGEFTTRGVSLFMSMPTVINNLEAFDLMLKTAQQLRSALNGELKDDRRNVMTAQTIEHYRQRVRDFELRRLKAAQA